MTEAFEQYAIVELFGRSVIAGMVREQVIGGQGFVRVDVPAIDGQEAFTKFYGPGAIYAITPTDEKSALAAVQSLRQKPIDVWKLNLPALPRSEEDLDGTDEDDREARF
jgi:hypothetical protein